MNRTIPTLCRSRLLVMLGALAMGGAAPAQERIPEPGLLVLDVQASAADVRVGFPFAASGIAVAVGSTSSETFDLWNLPPILAHVQATQVFVVGEGTQFVLRRWHDTYYAQFGLLRVETGQLSASQVLEVAAAGDPDAGEPPADLEEGEEIDPGAGG